MRINDDSINWTGTPTTAYVRKQYASVTFPRNTDVSRAEFDRWLVEHDRRVRDDERRELFAELTRGILFDGDTDRTIKAAYSRREKAVPVTVTA